MDHTGQTSYMNRTNYSSHTPQMDQTGYKSYSGQTGNTNNTGFKKNFVPYRPYINYNLQDSAACDFLRNKIILLSGPPGSGKTTLARIIARQCGYNPIEVVFIQFSYLNK